MKSKKGKTTFMALLKQKAILFNAFSPWGESSTTINSAVLKSLERAFIMACLLLPQSPLFGKFLQSGAAQAHSSILGVKGQSSS